MKATEGPLSLAFLAQSQRGSRVLFPTATCDAGSEAAVWEAATFAKRLRCRTPLSLLCQQPHAPPAQHAETPLAEAPQLGNEDRDLGRMVCLVTLFHPQASDHGQCFLDLLADVAFNMRKRRLVISLGFASFRNDSLKTFME